jgi:glucose-1-phosphate thymidylyltransferase
VPYIYEKRLLKRKMPEPLNIIIPMAGWATRLRPQTWSKPKPLVSVAGKASLDHLLDSFHSLPHPQAVEYTFITSPFLSELQMKAYMAEHHPRLKVNYVVQDEMKGQSHALWLAREHLCGPALVIYADTLIQTDFSFIGKETSDIVGWVKPVPDPRRFGVAEVNHQGQVIRLIEKPSGMENKLVVVGCYYFRESRDLVAAIEEQMQRGILFKGEYFLTDTINIMLEQGAKMRTQQVDVWLDTGTLEALLDTNRYLLEHGHGGKDKHADQNDVTIVEPVFIHKTAQISKAVIGPHVSIGEGCSVTNARIQNSILEAGARVNALALSGSIIGRQSQVEGRSADTLPVTMNIGDNCSITIHD